MIWIMFDFLIYFFLNLFTFQENKKIYFKK